MSSETEVKLGYLPAEDQFVLLAKNTDVKGWVPLAHITELNLRKLLRQTEAGLNYRNSLVKQGVVQAERKSA